MSILHPSKTSLRDWLAGELDVKVDTHVETCQRCATVLEELDATDDVGIGDALAEALAPDQGLTERLEQGLTARLSSRQVLDVVADLFGAGIETSRLLLIEDTDDNN